MTPTEIIKGILDDCADRTLPIDGEKLVQCLHDNGWTFTPMHTATDRSPLQMLAIMVEMVEMYCPSLANSGGVQMAKAMCADTPAPDDEKFVRLIAWEMKRFLDRADVTYSDTHPLTEVGIDGRVNLVELARHTCARVGIHQAIIAREKAKEGT
jgi:hypothetical protein